MPLGSTGTPGTHQPGWRRAGGRGRAPDSKEGRVGKPRGGMGRVGRQVGEAESQAEVAGGAQGPGSAGAPWVEPSGPKSEPPAFTQPSSGPQRASLQGLHPECRLQAASLSQASARPPARQRGRPGPRSRGGHWAWQGCGGQEVTQSPWNQPWGLQTDRLGMPGCFPLARRLGALPRGALPPPAPRPPPSPPPGAGGGGQ